MAKTLPLTDNQILHTATGDNFDVSQTEPLMVQQERLDVREKDYIVALTRNFAPDGAFAKDITADQRRIEAVLENILTLPGWRAEAQQLAHRIAEVAHSLPESSPTVRIRMTMAMSSLSPTSIPENDEVTAIGTLDLDGIFRHCVTAASQTTPPEDMTVRGGMIFVCQLVPSLINFHNDNRVLGGPGPGGTIFAPRNSDRLRGYDEEAEDHPSSGTTKPEPMRVSGGVVGGGLEGIKGLGQVWRGEKVGTVVADDVLHQDLKADTEKATEEAGRETALADQERQVEAIRAVQERQTDAVLAAQESQAESVRAEYEKQTEAALVAREAETEAALVNQEAQTETVLAESERAEKAEIIAERRALARTLELKRLRHKRRIIAEYNEHQSETIAALAEQMASAEGEISNPEKSGLLEPSRPFAEHQAAAEVGAGEASHVEAPHIEREPEARELEVREAEVNEPEAREPEAGEPEAREIEANAPEARESEARETEVNEPEARESEARESEARESEVREGEANEPEAREPEVRQAEAREPEVREPEARESETREPEVRQAEAREPEVREPGARESAATERETGPAGEAHNQENPIETRNEAGRHEEGRSGAEQEERTGPNHENIERVAEHESRGEVGEHNEHDIVNREPAADGHAHSYESLNEATPHIEGGREPGSVSPQKGESGFERVADIHAESGHASFDNNSPSVRGENSGNDISNHLFAEAIGHGNEITGGVAPAGAFLAHPEAIQAALYEHAPEPTPSSHKQSLIAASSLTPAHAHHHFAAYQEMASSDRSPGQLTTQPTAGIDHNGLLHAILPLHAGSNHIADTTEKRLLTLNLTAAKHAQAAQVKIALAESKPNPNGLENLTLDS